MTDRSDGAARSPAPRRLAWLAAAALMGAAIGLAAVYGIGGFQRNAGVAAACRAASPAAERMVPLVQGEVAAVAVANPPRPVPDLTFKDASGQTKSLADWRGRVVLLNLWATWCVPCRKEMPALDGLQARLGSERFEVVALNIDTRDTDKPQAWLHDIGVNHLSYYADPTAKVFQELKAAGWAFGMPTTLIVDPQGCELAALAGPAEWSSDDGVKLVEAAIGK